MSLLLVIQFQLLTSIVLADDMYEDGPSVWPQPQTIFSTGNYFSLSASSFQLLPSLSCEVVDKAIRRYQQLMFGPECKAWQDGSNDGDLEGTARHPHPQTEQLSRGQVINMVVHVEGECEHLPTEGIDESYSLLITGDGKSCLTGRSVWGVLRGLETLSQLIVRGPDSSFQVPEVEVVDYPRYQYRGLLVDTSRHFIPVTVLKQNLDAMAFNKLNVFHWHIVDDQSFPFVSQSSPLMHVMGSYHPVTHVYSPSDVKEVIEYARLRGIRVMPEFDTPGHTLSWRGAPRGFRTQCHSHVDGSPIDGKFGPVDPTSEDNFQFMSTILSEVKAVFPDKVVHVGGDEVDFDCWKSNPGIRQFMATNQLGNYSDLQSYYMRRVMDMAMEKGATPMVWEEVFNHGADFSGREIIHVWMAWTKAEWQEVIRKATATGLRTVLSAPWYLNHHEYGIDWKPFYETEPGDFGAANLSQQCLLIGGSVCMWTEYVNAHELMPKTWARASAAAERFWSDRSVNSWEAAIPRLSKMTCHMMSRGLRVNCVNGPDYCPCEKYIS